VTNGHSVFRTMDDTVHTPACDPAVAWTTINASEALPGVVTPLTWSIYHDPGGRRGPAVERVLRAAGGEPELVPGDGRPHAGVGRQQHRAADLRPGAR